MSFHKRSKKQGKRPARRPSSPVSSFAMGQCHSDVDSLSGGQSLPPTLSNSNKQPYAEQSELEISGGTNRLSSSPPVLTPRQRKKIVGREVITTLSPPQSPDIVPRNDSKKSRANQRLPADWMSLKIKVTHSRDLPAMMTKRFPVFSESAAIDVIDIPSKLIFCVDEQNIESSNLGNTIPEKIDLGQLFSPPVPFQKHSSRDIQKRVSPSAKMEANKEDSELQMAKRLSPPVSTPVRNLEVQQKINENEDKFVTRFENTLQMIFVCYLVGIAFFCLMCFNAFTQPRGIVPNTPVVGGMDMPAPAPVVATVTERKKARFDFLEEVKQNVVLLGEFSIQQDFVDVLPLNAVRHLVGQLLIEREHAFATIHAELEKIDDNVLI